MLVFLALTILGIVAIMGIAIDMGYMYVSYARLRRSVDAAALSATSQFRKKYGATDVVKAAKEFLFLNEQTMATTTTHIKIESCAFIDDDGVLTDYSLTNPVKEDGTGGSGDATLCTYPPRKLVRVTVTEEAPTFFLKVIGFSNLPITAASTSEAASLEMVLVLDSSDSMAWYKPPPDGETEWPIPSDNRDPKLCSPSNSCHPFKEVKDTAKEFIDTYLYPPYDRVGIITFSKYAHLMDPTTGREIPSGSPNTPILTSNIDLLDDILVGGNTVGQNAPGLMVYGVGTDPITGSQRAPYDEVHSCGSPGYGGIDFPDGFGYYDPSGIDTYALRLNTFENPEEAPCRLYQTTAGGVFWQLYAPGAGFTPPDQSFVGTSNIGAGLRAAAHVFGNPNEILRQEALWVTILLTDGVANIAFDDGGNLICPSSEKEGATNSTDPTKLDAVCRDNNPLVRHCRSGNVGTDPSQANYYACMNQVAPTGFTWPSNWTWPATTNTVDSTLYDVDDYARDMADLLHDSAHSLIFAIALQQDPNNSSDAGIYHPAGTPTGGEALLTYVAAKGGTEILYHASAEDLPSVFLAIANKIATRLTH